MRRNIGLTLIAASLIATVLLAMTGDLGVTTTPVDHRFVGGVSVANANIEIDPNWWFATPLIVCLVVGFICVIIPMKKSG